MIHLFQVNAVLPCGPFHEVCLPWQILMNEEVAAGTEHEQIPAAGGEEGEVSVRQDVVERHRLLGKDVAAEFALPMTFVPAAVTQFAEPTGEAVASVVADWHDAQPLTAQVDVPAEGLEVTMEGFHTVRILTIKKTALRAVKVPNGDNLWGCYPLPHPVQSIFLF